MPNRLVWKNYNGMVIEGEKSLTICLAVSIKYWRVTDGQTDGHLAMA